jgi:hypothetical protein
MNTQIKELLDKIDDKYPKSRLERNRLKWDDLWNLNTPFTSPPVALHRGRYADGAGHPVHHTLDDRRKLLATMLEDIVQTGDIDDDYLPVLTLDTGAYILAEAFGGEHVYMGDMYMIEKFLKTPDDVKNLQAFDPDGKHSYVVMANPMIAGIHFSQLNAEDFMPLITRPMTLHSRNDWTSFEQFQQYAAVAEQYNMRIAYQFQSLGSHMQVGADRFHYDTKLMNDLFTGIQRILGEIYHRRRS